jgi:hypothetical protein
MSSNINQIIFKNINDDYSYGMYGDFTVIIHTKSGYINVTKLCSDDNKLYKNWLRNDKSDDIIKEVNSKLGPNNKYTATFLVKGGKGEVYDIIRGTYAHPLIVPQVAQWISVKFALMVSEIINQHLVDEYLLKLDEKDDEIESLNVTIKRMEKKLDNITNELRLTRDELGDANDKLDETNYHLDEANDKIDYLKDELIDKKKDIKLKDKIIDIATDRRVPSTRSITKTENFIVMKRTNKKLKEDQFRYYIIAGQRSYTNRKAKELLDEKYIEIIRLEDVNNSKNILHRFIERVRNNKTLHIRGNQLNLIKLTEEQLVKKLKSLFEDRKSVDVSSSESDSDNSDSE